MSRPGIAYPGIEVVRARDDDGATEAFRQARNLLLEYREDYQAACREFRWPRPAHFNWALDWFDVLAADPDRRDQPALRLVRCDAEEIVGDYQLSYAELAERSNRLANWLRELGVRRGDSLLVMLGNQIPLWETMLAAMKLGAVIVPSPVRLSRQDVADRLARAEVEHVVVTEAEIGKFEQQPGLRNRIVVVDGTGEHRPTAERPARADGWLDYAAAYSAAAGFEPDAITRGSDLLLLYFTSGSTARPKIVQHSHASWPIGQLSTMYTLGLRASDRHVNISSPGWAKHSCSALFAPWSAEACVVAVDQQRFNARGLLNALAHTRASTLCAPPTVWRMLLQEELAGWSLALREAMSAGEPLNETIIDQIRQVWGLTVRDAYGQTEATGLVGNSPGQRVLAGSMGRPLPGYRVALRDPESGELAAMGEICVDVSDRPVGLTPGYRNAPERSAESVADSWYLTGDMAVRDEAGYFTFLGRRDELFKSSDYRISPFELESALLEHAAVAEVAVSPFPDPLRLATPKAYVVLAAGWPPTQETAQAILRFARDRLAPYKRVRRIEFGDLPRTVTGKILRAELRDRDAGRAGCTDCRSGEFCEQAGGKTEQWIDTSTTTEGVSL